MHVLTARLFETIVEPDASSILHVFLLSVLCGVLYFPYLGSTAFFDKGEPREALAVQDIVRRGEWLFPLKRATDIPSKPPLFHWSAASVSKVMGRLDEFTTRLPSAFYATLGVIVIYLFGRNLFGAQIALLGGGILATTLIYTNQALTARVDMTLCFFMTLSLVIFYSLYRQILTGGFWYYVFYIALGIGVLAKGPLGILLPGLVIGSFLALKKRWDLVSKLFFHPGVILTLLLVAGWYGIALTRGGEDFMDRQLLQENIERFAGGSGHSHPVYYYITYLFSQGLPWSLFLPFLLWGWFKQSLLSDDDTLFLKLWFVAMFAFFSISMGKRPVYLLPLYPALSLLMAVWFYKHDTVSARETVLYRSVAMLAGLLAVLLLIISVGAMWNHDPGWFFAPIESVLKPKDRANLLLVKNSLAAFGASFTAISLVSSLLWLSLSQCLWAARLRPATYRLILISILSAFVSRGIVIPVIAEARSYRPFMEQVEQRIKPGDKLYLFGESFNSDSVVFYHGRPIETIDQSPEAIAAKIGPGNNYIIMTKQTWAEIQDYDRSLPAPVFSSMSTGQEGDASLVMIQTRG
ncbi:MAG: dolichyl-phosphate-mannose-protein mannosyltransferase [Deltaproteobacteria bacterium]|nr:dolichyl-phosphate-mannose-protein mannosyltransferase [Deltaproteobacteria bacterium]